MCFLRSPLLTGWLESKNKMVEFEPLIWEGWQEDATLFPTTEPNGFLNFDELLDGKINNAVPLDADCNDLNWLDEKVDLSAILQTPPTEEEYCLIDEAVNLLFDSGNIDSYLSKNEPNILESSINGTQDHTASSINYSVAVDCFETISEAGSPAPSFVDKSEYLTSSGVCLSPPGQVVPADFCQSPSYSSTSRGRLSSNDFSLPPSETSYCNTPGGQSTADEYCQSPPDFRSLLGSPETSDEYLTSSGVCSSPPGQVVPADFCQSPSYSSTSRGRLPSNDFSLPPSETSYCNTPGGQSTADEYCQSPPDFRSLLGSPETSDVFSPAPSELTSNSSSEEAAAESSVSVMVYDVDPETIVSDSKDLSIEEVTMSVRKRKFVNNGKEIPKVRVALDNVFHPYKKSEGGRPRNKNDRKKVQNKEAAARYRMKKKLEQQEIVDEVSTLESQQKDLQKKHDSLVSEIKYLKSLMCEMLQKKGVLK